MRKPSPSLLVAVIVGVLAMGGTAIAAKQYVITSSKQIKPSVRHALKGSHGRRGRAGKTGPRGATGADGGPGITNTARVAGPASYQGGFGSGAEVASSTATCPAGSVAIGSGFVADGIDNLVEYQVVNTTSVSVIGVNEYSDSSSIQAEAVCASGPGARAASAEKTGSVTPDKADNLTSRVTRIQSELDKKH